MGNGNSSGYCPDWRDATVKFVLELEIDPFDEHLALELQMSITEYNKPIMYWDPERNCLRELKPINAKLNIKEIE